MNADDRRELQRSLPPQQLERRSRQQHGTAGQQRTARLLRLEREPSGWDTTVKCVAQ
jgi:hypothetical protein